MSNLKKPKNKGQGSKVMRKRVYLDYAATTPLDPNVKKAMEPFMSALFGNPSSIHLEGFNAKKALDNARTSVARFLEAHSDEIVFTSGGTEANNLAIHGVIHAVTDNCGNSGARINADIHERPHIVTTNIEHSSVLEPLRALEARGEAEVTYVPVESDGIVKPEKIAAAIRPDTVLVSVMYANNEIGTIQPIRKIAQYLRNFAATSNFELRTSNFKLAKPIFHADACQAPLYLNCLANALQVDLLSLDGHKIYGPKGIGALYVRRGTQISPQIRGGGQERGLRSTTENVPAIIGLAKALEIASADRETESTRIEGLRNLLYSKLYSNIGHKDFYSNIPRNIGIVVNGSMEKRERLPNNLNISLPDMDTEMLVLMLDAKGIAVSTKSSCMKGEKESYVIKALGRDKERSKSSLRITLGRRTTKSEIDFTVKALSELFRG